MMQRYWRQSPVMAKKSCQPLTSDDTILESCPTNQSIIPTLSSKSTLTETTMTSRILNANRPPVLSFGIACSILLLLISACIGIADAKPYELSGPDFLNIGCKGRYSASRFARLVRICDDCFNLYREPTVYNLCREDCFTTVNFKGCVDSLYLQDELEEIKSHVEYLHGAII